MVRRWSWLLVLPSCLALGACADVWGLQTLETGDAGPGHPSDGGGGGTGDGDQGDPDGSGSSSGGSSSGGSSSGGSGDGAASGSCAPDFNVTCSDPADIAFSCTGSATPAQSYPGATCGAGASGTSCCGGNWCGQPFDTDACDQCTQQSCPSPACACDSQCLQYYACMANCGGSLAQCEQQCAPAYSADVVTAGDDVIACQAQYCNAQCQIE
jgi:hypothetical protein